HDGDELTLVPSGPGSVSAPPWAASSRRRRPSRLLIAFPGGLPGCLPRRRPGQGPPFAGPNCHYAERIARRRENVFMPGPAQPWDQPEDPGDQTVDMPRIDLAGFGNWCAAPENGAPSSWHLGD